MSPNSTWSLKPSDISHPCRLVLFSKLFNLFYFSFQCTEAFTSIFSGQTCWQNWSWWCCPSLGEQQLVAAAQKSILGGILAIQASIVASIKVHSRRYIGHTSFHKRRKRVHHDMVNRQHPPGKTVNNCRYQWALVTKGRDMPIQHLLQTVYCFLYILVAYNFVKQMWTLSWTKSVILL